MTARKEQMKQSIVQEVSNCDSCRPQSQAEDELGLTIQLAVANAQQLINKINDNVRLPSVIWVKLMDSVSRNASSNLRHR
jgi:hypothetical protein